MKARFLLIPLIALSMALAGCESEFARAMFGAEGFKASDINGTWRHDASGIVVMISGVGNNSPGTGYLMSGGSHYPSGATGGQVLRTVEHQSGGYWDAYHYTYQTNGQWVYTHIVGLAMTDDKKEFRIGSAVYRRQ
jgi:hypothetical protein